MIAPNSRQLSRDDLLSELPVDGSAVLRHEGTHDRARVLLRARSTRRDRLVDGPLGLGLRHHLRQILLQDVELLTFARHQVGPIGLLVLLDRIAPLLRGPSKNRLGFVVAQLMTELDLLVLQGCLQQP